MTTEEQQLRTEIEKRKRLNRTLGAAFEQVLSSRTFDAEAAIAIILHQQRIDAEIAELSKELQRLPIADLDNSSIDESSLDRLLKELNITRPTIW